MPLFSTNGDLILILYLLMMPSLAMVIGGFASGSPYATVGAQREMATMIGYEFPLAIVIIAFAWKIGSHIDSGGLGLENAFALSTITSVPIWNVVTPIGFIGFAILLIVLIIVTPGELSKIPYDSPEAETEIAGGLLVEYSGRNLGMFYLTDGVKTVVMASVIVALFFPYNLSNIFGLTSYSAYAVDIIFYLIKVLLVIFFSVTLIRVSVARLKIDQIVYTYWVPLTLMGLVGLILVMWDANFGLQTVAQMLGFA
jgi:formate hydrogenlyase subunit 4